VGRVEVFGSTLLKKQQGVPEGARMIHWDIQQVTPVDAPGELYCLAPDDGLVNTLGSE